MEQTKIRIAFLITGSEVVDGRIFDTNSNYLSNRFAEYGLVPQRILACNDDEAAISDSLWYLAERNEVIIVSGGLGPTTGDRTREAIAKACGRKLVLDEASLETIKAFFVSRNRPFSENNTKQATFPENSQILHNPCGTAPGFVLELTTKSGHSCYVYSLPGVPWELKAMFSDEVLPHFEKHVLKGVFLKNRLPFRLMRTFGLGEAIVSERVAASSPHPSVDVCFRVSFPEVQVLMRPKDQTTPLETLEASFKKAKDSVEEKHIFSEDFEVDLPKALHELLLKSHKTLAVAESCTGGLLGSLITNCPGASQYFLGGVVSYSNEIKQRLLGVSEETLKFHGAVSQETAKEMALGVMQSLGSDYALSITGIAGPGGGTPEKPVGTFFVGLATTQSVTSHRYLLPGTRERVRTFAAHTALSLLRQELMR